MLNPHMLHQHVSSGWQGPAEILFPKAAEEVPTVDKAKLLQTFYTIKIEYALAYRIRAWFASSSAKDKKAVQDVKKSAQKTVGCPCHPWKTSQTRNWNSSPLAEGTGVLPAGQTD